MSMSNVLGYARTRMKALNFIEHDDANNDENIGRTALNDAFHLELNTFSADGENQDNLHISAPFTLTVYKNTRRDTNESRDVGIILIDTIIDSFVKASNRLNISGIQTITFDSGKIERTSESNDNAFTITLEFTALVIKSTR